MMQLLTNHTHSINSAVVNVVGCIGYIGFDKLHIVRPWIVGVGDVPRMTPAIVVYFSLSLMLGNCLKAIDTA